MDIYADDSIYLHVSSKDSRAYFPQNKGNNFRVKLAKRLELVGAWKIALCEINVSNVVLGTRVRVADEGDRADDDTICVHCNVCIGLIVNGVQTRILRTLPLKKNQYKIYPVHYYCPLETQYIDTIEFDICTSNGKAVSFDVTSGHVSMTLRLKRC